VLTFGDAPSLSGVDIEDIAAKMRYQNKVESQRPLVGSLALFDGHEFVSDQLLREQMALLSSVYPAGQEFILRAQTKLAMDMERLNERIGFVLSHLQVVSKRAASTSSSSSSSSTTPPSAAIPRVPSPILLVESSCERLELLAQLPSSVFLDPLVYPALRMYVIRGEEAEAMQQLTEFIEAMRVRANASREREEHQTLRLCRRDASSLEGLERHSMRRDARGRCAVSGSSRRLGAAAKASISRSIHCTVTRTRPRAGHGCTAVRWRTSSHSGHSVHVNSLAVLSLSLSLCE